MTTVQADDFRVISRRVFKYTIVYYWPEKHTWKGRRMATQKCTSVTDRGAGWLADVPMENIQFVMCGDKNTSSVYYELVQYVSVYTKRN